MAWGAVRVFALKIIFSVLYKDGNEKEPLERTNKEAGRLVMK